MLFARIGGPRSATTGMTAPVICKRCGAASSRNVHQHRRSVCSLYDGDQSHMACAHTYLAQQNGADTTSPSTLSASKNPTLLQMASPMERRRPRLMTSGTLRLRRIHPASCFAGSMSPGTTASAGVKTVEASCRRQSVAAVCGLCKYAVRCHSMLSLFR